jgi:hypothetical protein
MGAFKKSLAAQDGREKFRGTGNRNHQRDAFFVCQDPLEETHALAPQLIDTRIQVLLVIDAKGRRLPQHSGSPMPYLTRITL